MIRKSKSEKLFGLEEQLRRCIAGEDQDLSKPEVVDDLKESMLSSVEKIKKAIEADKDGKTGLAAPSSLSPSSHLARSKGLKMPVFELVFKWQGLDFTGEVRESSKSLEVVVLDEKFAKAWDELEEKILDITLRKGDKTSQFNKLLPESPWRWAYDFFRRFDLSDAEKRSFSRIELRNLKNPDLVYVIYDHSSYRSVEQTFLECDCISDGSKTKKVDLAAERESKIQSGDEHYKKQVRAVKRKFGGSRKVEDAQFATLALAQARCDDLPILEVLASEEEARKKSEDDDDDVPF